MNSAARTAYDTLAPAYDEYTRANNYELWLGEFLLPELQRRGLRRGRALDVGCGTGRAFEPLLRRGWEVVGCDVSPAMLDQARAKFGDAVPIVEADLRELPVLGSFDLVLALNDVLNYLTEDGELERAVRSLGANLAAGGRLLFDVNTLRLFRAMYTPDAEAEGTYETILDDAGVTPHAHRQRHSSQQRLRAAIADAGLDLLAMLGQREDGDSIVLSEEIDEDRDDKIVCIAGLP
ncbi:MAG: class I SAM-dependent methyltransferase [Solirubrobacterales bacterium]